MRRKKYRKYTRKHLYRNPHPNLHSSHDFRKRKSYTGLIIVLIIIAVIVIIFLYDIGGVKTKVQDNLNLSAMSNLLESNKIVDTCPQINVPMKEYTYRQSDISGLSYDGWVIKGQATCRKGLREGENLNKYYCGGYTYTFGMGSVNAYVEKTIISESGQIGKTYKYVIWNIYDENKNFIETRCLGDPDEFEEKQARDFMNELKSWG